MPEYAKTLLSDALSVDSVMTAFHGEWHYIEPVGESHNFWELVYVDSGTFEVSIDNDIYIVKEGQMIIYPPHSFHVIAKQNPVKLNIVSFDSPSETISAFAKKVITLSGKQRQILSQIVSIGEGHFKKITDNTVYKGMELREETDAFTLQTLKNQLELLLIDIYVKKESTGSKPTNFNYENFSNNTFNVVTEYLKDNIKGNLSLTDICNDCKVSIYQLKRACKNQCGLSPMSYFISLKIEAAKKMICDTDLNFTQISENLGFSTVHYFSKVFKDKVGVTPSEYAKSVYKE